MSLFLLAMIVNQAGRNEEDVRLLLRVKERDQTAFSELYDRYSPLVYALVLKIIRATDEAEDLSQEIFLQIWNKAAMFAREKGSVYTWIVTIARRKAIDRLRSKDIINKGQSLDNEENMVTIPDASYMSSPLHAAITEEQESLMRNGLAQLSVEQRTILELSYYEGFTQEQISERLKVPLGTVKTRMRNGLIKLRDNLQGRIE